MTVLWFSNWTWPWTYYCFIYFFNMQSQEGNLFTHDSRGWIFPFRPMLIWNILSFPCWILVETFKTKCNIQCLTSILSTNIPLECSRVSGDWLAKTLDYIRLCVWATEVFQSSHALSWVSRWQILGSLGYSRYKGEQISRWSHFIFWKGDRDKGEKSTTASRKSQRNPDRLSPTEESIFGYLMRY